MVLPAETVKHPTLLRSFPYWLPPALLALGLTLLYLNPFIGDWDALEYTVHSVRGKPSPMALGRSVFTLFNHGLYTIAHKLFGVGPEHAYLIFKYVVVAAVPLAIILCWVLARDLTGSIYSATIAASLIGLSPILVLYGGQVMTEVPSVLVWAAAMVVHLRGVRRRSVWLMLAGAALLGLGVNLRETVGLFMPWLVVAPFVAGWKLNFRSMRIVGGSLLIFFAFAFGIFLLWFVFDPAYRGEWYIWRNSMLSESARHPVGLASLKPFFLYFFLSAPLVLAGLPFAFRRELRERGWSLLLTAASVGLLANAMLFLNYSTTINWRYFLTGLPAIAPLVGDYFWRAQTETWRSPRRGFFGAVAGVLLVAALMGLLFHQKNREYANRLAQAKDYDASLKQIPRDAVVIAGAQTVAVIYRRGIGGGEWDHIGVGAGWPAGKLTSKIDEHLRSGRRVFLDADPRWWLPCSWHAAEIPELAGIEKHFHFRRIAPTIFEIRPIEDTRATDQPHLENLLPANRPEEVKRCSA